MPPGENIGVLKQMQHLAVEALQWTGRAAVLATTMGGSTGEAMASYKSTSPKTFTVPMQDSTADLLDRLEKYKSPEQRIREIDMELESLYEQGNSIISQLDAIFEMIAELAGKTRAERWAIMQKKRAAVEKEDPKAVAGKCPIIVYVEGEQKKAADDAEMDRILEQAKDLEGTRHTIDIKIHQLRTERHRLEQKLRERTQRPPEPKPPQPPSQETPKKEEKNKGEEGEKKEKKKRGGGTENIPIESIAWNNDFPRHYPTQVA